MVLDRNYSLELQPRPLNLRVARPMLAVRVEERVCVAKLRRLVDPLVGDQEIGPTQALRDWRAEAAHGRVEVKGV